MKSLFWSLAKFHPRVHAKNLKIQEVLGEPSTPLNQDLIWGLREKILPTNHTQSTFKNTAPNYEEQLKENYKSG
jgi:hypothetical protein